MLIENSVHTIETSTGPMRVDLVSPKVPGYPKVGRGGLHRDMCAVARQQN